MRLGLKLKDEGRRDKEVDEDGAEMQVKEEEEKGGER